MAEGRLIEFTLAKVIQLVKQKSSVADCRVYSFHQPLGCISLDQDQPPPMKVNMFVNPKSQSSSSQDEARAQQRCKQTDCSSRTSPPLLPYGFPMVLCLALFSKHTVGLKDTQQQGHYSFWKCPDWLPSLFHSSWAILKPRPWREEPADQIIRYFPVLWGLSKPSERHHLMYHAPTI